MATRKAYLASFESLPFNQGVALEIKRIEKLIDEKLRIFENIYRNGMTISILIEPAFPLPRIEVESGLKKENTKKPDGQWNFGAMNKLLTEDTLS